MRGFFPTFIYKYDCETYFKMTVDYINLLLLLQLKSNFVHKNFSTQILYLTILLKSSFLIHVYFIKRTYSYYIIIISINYIYFEYYT